MGTISAGDYVGIGEYGIMLHDVRGWKRGRGMIAFCTTTQIVRTFARSLFSVETQQGVRCTSCEPAVNKQRRETA